ncbi:MAG TPA: HAMP domain-containing sensor histidine kinase [Ktedonobacterales bacterium]|jgi:two-component system OmpR family sensor kinase|nr:HAMP domain-containing sensor histidine kinase [Ktedonobacterales bacterium]
MAIEPPASSQPAADTMRAGEPTVTLPAARTAARRPRGAAPLWPRTLRWRLILTFAALLGLTLALLGVALNVLIARALYTTEFGFFQNESLAAVSASQSRLDSLTLGRAANCSDALPYETAFQQAIADPITVSHPGSIQGVYLLDSTGAVLAPISAQSGASATRYLQPRRLARLSATASATFNPNASAAGSQQLANEGYFVNNRVAPYGVELIALRYYTTSRCATPRHAALGYVEIVTTFTRTRLALGAIRLTLFIIMALVFVVGLLIGAPLTAAALRPLSRVTQAARRVAAGDLSQRVRLPHTDDEMGQLGATFDDMVARIEAAFSARRRSEERMRQFIADASHELRTPLTSIRGYTDVLLRGAKDDPETTERVLLATRREAERMSRLVNDLLTLARLDTGRPLETQPLDLMALAGECVDQARILAGQREVMMRTDGRGRLMVMGDPDRLKQVLLVLLDNALKYGRQTPDGWARLSIGRRDGQAVVTVEDNGPGIAPEDLPRIFERFYRAERAEHLRRLTSQSTGAPAPGDSGAQPAGPPRAEGSGLGLAIAQAIARAHGGALTVQSAPGSGTTFTLTLPLSQANDHATSTSQVTRPGA